MTNDGYPYRVKDEMKLSDNYLPGIIISLLLAGWLALLSIAAVTTDDLGWGAIGLLLGALFIGGPLAILLVIFWVVYMRRSRGQLPGRLHALLILPTLCALIIIPIGETIKEQKRNNFIDRYPPISEIHINLSGQDLGLDDEPLTLASRSEAGPILSAANAERFVELSNYPRPETIQAQTFPYDGGHLKANINTYRYMRAPYYNAPPAHPPVALRRRPYPDLKGLSKITGESESALLVQLYFHYPDYVELAPAIAGFVSSMNIATKDKTAQQPVIFDLYNYLPSPIVRLEVNGQTLDLGDHAAYSTPPLPSRCRDFPKPSGAAFVDPGQPLTLRWQTLDQPQRWRMATVEVPGFSRPLPENEKNELNRVLFYFLPDGTVAAERYLEIRSGEGKLAIRATGVPPQAHPYASCGSIYSRYNPEMVKLLAN